MSEASNQEHDINSAEKPVVSRIGRLPKGVLVAAPTMRPSL